MIAVEDLCNLILVDSHEEMIQVLNEKRLLKDLNRAMANYFNLSADERKLYTKEVQTQKRTHHKPWHQILLEAVPYSLPVIVNGETYYAMWRLGEEQQVYAYVDFVRPGKTFYSVKHQGSLNVHRILSRHRQEKVPPHKRARTQPRFFVKAGSVFSGFNDNSADIGNKCFEYDAKMWKLPKIMRRDPQDLRRLEYLLREEYPNMLEMYDSFRAEFGNIYSIPCSGFKKLTAAMGILKQSQFAKQDDPSVINVIPADIERFMIACNFQDANRGSVGPSLGKLDSALA